MITLQIAKKILKSIKDIMAENRDILIELDSRMGDGDLGLTMTSAFNAAWEQSKESDDTDIGMFFAKAGMIIARTAPSTMGTLVGTGFMRGGKAVSGSKEMDAESLRLFFRAFAVGLMERGKVKPGEKTVVDVFEPVATTLEQTEGDDLGKLLSKAVEAAEEGVKMTKLMKAQHGRAAYYQEQSVGQQDPGATAGWLIIQGFYNGYVI